MAGTGRRGRKIWFGLGGVALAQAIAFGALTVISGTTTVHAQLSGVAKDCEGTGPNKEAIQNQSVTCTVKVDLGGPSGSEWDVQLAGPSGNVVTSCTKDAGFTGTVSGPTGQTCTWIATATANPQTVLGTEVIHIGSAQANGALLAQSGRTCAPAPLGCAPAALGGGFSNMQGPGNSGNGWCVGTGSTNQAGLALTCSGGPGLPGGSSTTTTTHTTSSGGGGGESSTTTTVNTTTVVTQTVANSVKALANTAAPAHPFPTAPLTIAVVSLLVAASAGLALLRTRKVGKSDDKS